MGATTSHDAIDRGRLRRFVGTLAAMSVVYTAGTYALGTDPASAAAIYMFTPTAAAVAALASTGDLSRDALGLRVGRPVWSAVAVVVVLPVSAAIVLVSVAVPGVGLDATPDLPAQLSPVVEAVGVPGAILAMVVTGVTVGAVLAAGEELGWRGYLLDELAPLGFWRASLAIGTLWGVWHAPAIVAGHNYPAFPVVGVGLMTVACVAMAPLYTYFVARADSALPAVFLHGSFNAVAGGLVMPYTATESTVLAELVASPVGLAGIAVFVAIALGIRLRGAPRLDRDWTAANGSRDRSGADEATTVDASPE